MSGESTILVVEDDAIVRMLIVDVLNEVTPLLNDSVAVDAVVVSSAVQGDAKKLNLKGEAAYQAGNLDQAIDYFRQAIELDNSFGNCSAWTENATAHNDIAEAIRSKPMLNSL